MTVQKINYEKGYEDLPKNSYEEYLQIMEDMDTTVEIMYKAINEGINKYKTMFLYSYTDWQRLKKLILKNPYNDCGHKLSEEIETAYNYIIKTYRDELYFTF